MAYADLTEKHCVEFHLTRDAQIEAGQGQQVDAEEKQPPTPRAEHFVVRQDLLVGRWWAVRAAPDFRVHRQLVCKIFSVKSKVSIKKQILRKP